MAFDLRLPAELAAFRADARAFLAAEMAEDRVAGHLDPTDLTGLDEAFERAHHRAAAKAGFLGISAPADVGGGGRPPSWASMYLFEAAYADAPSMDSAWTLCGPVIAAYATGEQRERWLSPMVRGEIGGCVAYTEPAAGSDLAGATTVAVPDGSGWRISGQKSLVTGAHKADICVTAALTDPAAGVRRGLTMFVLELPAEGVTITRRPTVNGWTLCDIDLDRAPVGPGSVLGTVGGGWPQLTGAAGQERSGLPHLGWATRVMQRLDEWAAGPPSLDRADRETLARLRIDIAAGWRFSLRVLAAHDAGLPGVVEAAAAKVFATELLARLARVGTDLVGVAALERGPLAAPMPAVPLGGRLGYEVLERIHPTISVGANELQRDLLARFELRLPRGPA